MTTTTTSKAPKVAEAVSRDHHVMLDVVKEPAVVIVVSQASIMTTLAGALTAAMTAGIPSRTPAWSICTPPRGRTH